MRMMKVAVLTGPRLVEIQERPVPVPAADEVLIRVRHVGICGSDLHFYEHGEIGSLTVHYPFVLGHEVGGEIESTGSEVGGLKPGDRVAVEPQRVCGRCEFCRTGRYNLCLQVRFLSAPPEDGAFAEFVVHPADMVHRLPAGLDTIDGALVEPMAVGFHVTSQAGARPGETAVVLGAGTVGLSTLMALRVRGITEIYVTDLVDSRLRMAEELGARAALDAGKTDVVREVMERSGDRGADMVFEMAGSSVTTQQTVELVKRGGRVLLAGFATEPVPFDFRQLIFKEASILTSRRYRNLYPTVIQAMAEGMVSARRLVTDMFPFTRIVEAIEHSLAHKDRSMKTIVEVN
jgi:L-iditol 2-dehydrogenase